MIRRVCEKILLKFYEIMVIPYLICIKNSNMRSRDAFCGADRFLDRSYRVNVNEKL